MKSLLVFISLFLIVVACSPQQSDPLAGKRWTLVELMGKRVTDTQKIAYLTFDAKTGHVAGSGGCNSISGGYVLEEPNRIRFTQMISTMMACMKGMDTEKQLLDTLAKTDSYYVNGNRLQLNRARMAPLAVFENDRMVD